MKLLKSLFSKREDVYIENLPSSTGDERITLVPIKTIGFKYVNGKYEKGKEIVIPAFSSLDVCYGSLMKLNGFSECCAFLLDEFNGRILIANDFLDNYCVAKYSKIKFKNGYEYNVGGYDVSDNDCNKLLITIKTIFVSIFLTFEEKAVDAFKAGLIDVFLMRFMDT